MGNVFEGDFVQRRIAAMDYKPGDSVGLTITITLHRQHYVYIVYLLTLGITRFWMWTSIHNPLIQQLVLQFLLQPSVRSR